MRFIGDKLAEGLDNARLADARLSQKHKDLSFTLNRLPRPRSPPVCTRLDTADLVEARSLLNELM
jgi:hypothetical protein